MNLDTKTIKDFVGLVNKTEKDKATTILTGTVHEQGDKIYVQIDGSDRLTPVSTVTNVADGERVTVTIENHKALITGNLSSPAARNSDAEDAGKVATNYIGAGLDGLTVGNLTEDQLNQNVHIGNSVISVRNGFKELATFSESLIELGKANPEATISLLNGLAKIVSSNDGTDVILNILSKNVISLGAAPENDDDYTAKVRVEDGTASLSGKHANFYVSDGLSAEVHGVSGMDAGMIISANRNTGTNKIDLYNGNDSKISMDGNATTIHSGIVKITGKQNEMTASVGKYTAYTRTAASDSGCAIDNSVVGVNKTLIQQWDNQIRFSRGKSTADVTAYSSENNKEWDLKAIYSGGTPVLASVALWPNASHTINLSMPVSVQPHGIVVEFAPYKDGKVQTYGYVTFFIPKARANGNSMCFTIFGLNFETPCFKWLYIYDTKIVGNDHNVESGSNNGITYNNKKYVLTKVYGV